jgi:hypothetical protein
MITPAVSSMTTRRALVVTMAAAIAVGGVLAGLALSGVFGGGSRLEPLSGEAAKAAPHQTMDALGTVENATARALPTATSTLTPQEQKEKIQAQALSDPRVPKSCPDALRTPGVFPRDAIHQPDPTFSRGPETGTAYGVGSNGIGYAMAAGSVSSKPEPEHWIIVTHPDYPDYCASLLGLAPEVAEGAYAVGPGPVTMTAIDGDVVTFTTGDGTTGRLNFVTGKFK